MLRVGVRSITGSYPGRGWVPAGELEVGGSVATPEQAGCAGAAFVREGAGVAVALLVLGFDDVREVSVREVFGEWYWPDDGDLRDVVTDGLIVLDANGS